MKERTYAMLKPDGVKKGLLKEVIRRFEKVGLTVSHIKEMELDAEIVKQHYAHLVDKPFYPTLEAFMLSGPVVAMIVEGESAVSKVRELMGATDSKDALPGTIRGDYGDKTCCTYNIIHGSDSLENAEIEIDRFYLVDLAKNKKEVLTNVPVFAILLRQWRSRLARFMAHDWNSCMR